MVKFILSILIKSVIVFVCFVTDIITLGYMIATIPFNSPRWWRVAVGKDQTGNAALGGSEDETLSSRAGRAAERGERWGCVLCKILDYVNKDHCKKSIGV